jgi:hypothetical protein
MSQIFKNKVKEKTDQELADIFLNAKEYQPEYITIVEQEMINRKVPNYETLKTRKEKLEEKANTEIEYGRAGTTMWIALYFLSSLFGGIIGIIAGYNYAFSERENSKGEKYYTFTKETRNMGMIMFFLGLIVLVLAIYMKIK